MKHVALVLFTTLLVPLVRAQEAPVHGELSTTYRSFGYAPESDSLSASLKLFPSPKCSIFVVGGGSNQGATTRAGQQVFFGGSDLEVGVTYRLFSDRLNVGLGASLPNSYSSKTEASYSCKYLLLPGFEVGLLGTTGRFGSSAVSLDKQLAVSKRLSISLDAAIPLAGYSTISWNTAKPIRTLLVAGAIRYEFAEGQTLSFGLTNRLGDSTALSLSSPISNHVGLLVSYGEKF